MALCDKCCVQCCSWHGLWPWGSRSSPAHGVVYIAPAPAVIAAPAPDLEHIAPDSAVIAVRASGVEYTSLVPAASFVAPAPAWTQYLRLWGSTPSRRQLWVTQFGSCSLCCASTRGGVHLSIVCGERPSWRQFMSLVVVSNVLARWLSASATQPGKFEESCSPGQKATQRSQLPEALQGHLEESCASAIAWHEQERQPVCSECPPRVGLVRPARKLRSLASMVRPGRRVDERAFRPRVLPTVHAAHAPVVEHWNCCRQFCNQCQVEWRRCASSTCSCACGDHSSIASGGVHRTGSRSDRAPVSGFAVCATPASVVGYFSSASTMSYAASAFAVCAAPAPVVGYISPAPAVSYAASALAACAAPAPVVHCISSALQRAAPRQLLQYVPHQLSWWSTSLWHQR